MSQKNACRLGTLLMVTLALLLARCGLSPRGKSGGQAVIFSSSSGLPQVGARMSVTYVGAEVEITRAHWTVSDASGTTVWTEGSGKAVAFVPESGGTFTARVSDGTHEALGSVDIAEPPGVNTTFGFVLTLRDPKGNVVGTVSTDPSHNSGQYALERGKRYRLSFTPLSATEGVLRFSLRSDAWKEEGNEITRTCDTVGAAPLVASAVNAAGEATQVTYTEYCQCEASADTLTLDPSKLAFIPDPLAPNVFLFDASKALRGGTPPYRFQWAPESTEVLSGWSDSAALRLGRVYADSEAGALQVVDACEFVHGTSFVHRFPIKMADGIPGHPQGPQENNHPFIQGQLSGLNTLGRADHYVQSRSFIAIAPGVGADNAGVVLTPDYDTDGSNGTLSLLGENVFIASDGTTRDTLHGLRLEVSGIREPAGGNGTADTSHAYITTVHYLTDGMGDGRASKTYVNQEDCPVQLSVTVHTGKLPCSDGSTVLSVGRTFDGTFHCPRLVAPDGAEMKLMQGGFYAEVSYSDQCPGGGGGDTGGGGGSDPRPR